LTLARAARGIQAQRAAGQRRRGVAGRAAQQGAQAGQQFLGVEGLGQVVVGPGVEAGDLVAPGAARGQDQHRRGDIAPPPALQHRDAVHLGQAEVEDHRIIGFGLAQELGFLAVGRMVDGVAGVAQGQLQLARQVGIVLDEQDTHGRLLTVFSRRSESGRCARRR
jgi:hypothetical protein